MSELAAYSPCNDHLTALQRICAALNARTDMDEMLRNTLQVSLETTQADAGSILIYDPEQNGLVFRHVVGPVAQRLIGTTIPLNSPGQCATVFKTGRAEIRDTGFDTSFDAQSHYHTVSTLTTPIHNFGGQPIGVIQVLNKREGLFTPRDQELLSVVSALAMTVLENAHRAEVEQEAALARAEAARQASLSRILGFIGHQLKNQALILDGARQTFGSLMAQEISHLQQNSGVDAASLEAYYHELDQMLDDATQKMIKQSRVINEYGERQDLFEFRVGDLKALLEEELAQLESVAGRHGSRLDLSQLRPVPPFAFEGFFIGQAVFNLVNNAFQAMREQGQGDTVWVRLDVQTEGRFPEGGYVEIIVEDNGPGMPPEILASILEGRSISTRAQGSGVGTRLVHDVVKTHGGTLTGTATPGHGTLFRLRLPLQRT